MSSWARPGSLGRAVLIAASALLLTGFAPGLAAPAWAADREISGLARRQTADSTGRAVTYYISRPSAGRAPILLFIQGSGCGPVLIQSAAGTPQTQVFSLFRAVEGGRFTVIVVEKPFADPANAGRGDATHCPAAFNADFNVDSWRAALRAALADARRLPWVDRSRALVIGVSEGAAMAGALAAVEPEVSDVALISGPGGTQLFDLIVRAYAGCAVPEDCVGAVEAVQRQASEILAHPDETRRFAWGHPYKRWASFFRLSVQRELLSSRARTYILAGTADASVPILSTEIAVAELTAAGRDVTVRRLPGRDHSLRPLGDASWTALNAEYERIFAWFWAR